MDSTQIDATSSIFSDSSSHIGPPNDTDSMRNLFDLSGETSNDTVGQPRSSDGDLHQTQTNTDGKIERHFPEQTLLPDTPLDNSLSTNHVVNSVDLPQSTTNKTIILQDKTQPDKTGQGSSIVHDMVNGEDLSGEVSDHSDTDPIVQTIGFPNQNALC